MSKLEILRFLFAILVVSGGVIASCPNQAGIMQFCPGHSNNACVGSTKSICEADDAETIQEHRFAVGYSPGRYPIPGGVALCWTEYPCIWDEDFEECVRDEANADPHDVAYFNADWCNQS